MHKTCHALYAALSVFCREEREARKLCQPQPVVVVRREPPRSPSFTLRIAPRYSLVTPSLLPRYPLVTPSLLPRYSLVIPSLPPRYSLVTPSLLPRYSLVTPSLLPRFTPVLLVFRNLFEIHTGIRPEICPIRNASS